MKIFCDNCGKKFDKIKSQIERNQHNFCNRDCYNKFQKEGYYKECEICKEEFWVIPSQERQRPARFCSYECRNNYLREKDKIQKECLECNKVFKTVKWKGQIFCSKDCYHSYYSGEQSPLFKEGEYIRNRGPNWQEQRKEALKRDNHKCIKCNTNKNLIVHHKIPYDTFDDYEKANKLNNLKTICRSCHSEIEMNFLKEKR